jgi:hypothetical protein
VSDKEQSPASRKRGWTVVSLSVIVPIGVYSKLYTGPAANWVNNSLSGVFYEIFWCVLTFLFLDNIKPWFIATSVSSVGQFWVLPSPGPTFPTIFWDVESDGSG